MTYYLYLILLFLSGFALASSFSRNKFLSLALTPFFSLFFPSLMILLLNLFKRPINNSFLVLWLFHAIFFIIIKRKNIIELFKAILTFFKSLNRFHKSFFILVCLGFFSFFNYIAVKPVWDGDGKSFRGPRAIHWIENESLTYTNESVELFGKFDHIIKTDPVYHSVGLMINIMALPFLPAYSVGLSDLYYQFGTFFTAMFFLHLLGFSNLTILYGAFATTFFGREILNYINSAYAVPNMNYFYFLATALLFATKKEIFKQKKLYFLLGLILGVMSITKAEGLFRSVILLFLFFPLLDRKNLISKKTFLIFAAFSTMLILNKLNVPYKLYNEYLGNINLTYSHLSRILPVAIESLIMVISPKGIFHCFWSLSIIIGCIAALSKNFPYKTEARFLLLLFFANAIFSILPNIITTSPVSICDSVSCIGGEIYARLFCQTTSIMAIISTLWIITKIKELIPSINNQKHFHQ